MVGLNFENFNDDKIKNLKPIILLSGFEYSSEEDAKDIWPRKMITEDGEMGMEELYVAFQVFLCC